MLPGNDHFRWTLRGLLATEMLRTTLGWISIRETDDPRDLNRIWESMLEPVLRSGHALCLPTDMTKEECLGYWAAARHRVFVAELCDPSGAGSSETTPLASYYLSANQGHGGHVASCELVMASGADRAADDPVLRHALKTAALDGFRAVRLDFVVTMVWTKSLQTNDSILLRVPLVLRFVGWLRQNGSILVRVTFLL